MLLLPLKALLHGAIFHATCNDRGQKHAKRLGRGTIWRQILIKVKRVLEKANRNSPSSGVTLYQGAPGSKFSKAPLVEAPKPRVERRVCTSFLGVQGMLTRYTRYKIIRDEKNVDMAAYYTDVSSLPFSAVYAFSDPEDMLESFNILIQDCIDRHAPIKRIKVTRPPCPWLKTGDIQALQIQRNKLRFEAHKTSLDSIWNAFRKVRNSLKTKIKAAKRSFYQTVLSSKNSKKIWKVIHSILNPPSQPLRHDPNENNLNFACTVQRTLGYTNNVSKNDLYAYIDSLPISTEQSFSLNKLMQLSRSIKIIA